MKWLKALKIGYSVLKAVEDAGVTVKGVPLKTLDEKVRDVVTSTKTVMDVFKK